MSAHKGMPGMLGACPTPREVVSPGHPSIHLTPDLHLSRFSGAKGCVIMHPLDLITPSPGAIDRSGGRVARGDMDERQGPRLTLTEQPSFELQYYV